VDECRGVSGWHVSRGCGGLGRFVVVMIWWFVHDGFGARSLRLH